MIWLTILINVMVPIVVKLIEKLVPERVTRKRGEMKWVKERKRKTIDYLEKFRGKTITEIADMGKKI